MPKNSGLSDPDDVVQLQIRELDTTRAGYSRSTNGSRHAAASNGGAK